MVRKLLFPISSSKLNSDRAILVKKNIQITTTTELSYTGAEITIKENQVALLGFLNNWNENRPEAMQILSSKTEFSVSTMISPEISCYPNRYSIIFRPTTETTLYVWTKHTGKDLGGSVLIEGVIFDL